MIVYNLLVMMKKGKSRPRRSKDGMSSIFDREAKLAVSSAELSWCYGMAILRFRRLMLIIGGISY